MRSRSCSEGLGDAGREGRKLGALCAPDDNDNDGGSGRGQDEINEGHIYVSIVGSRNR